MALIHFVHFNESVSFLGSKWAVQEEIDIKNIKDCSVELGSIGESSRRKEHHVFVERAIKNFNRSIKTIERENKSPTLRESINIFIKRS